MSGGGGNATISTSETKIEALSLQSSAYGVTIPVIYGANRIGGNMLWYGGFKATPHTTTTSSGGGGGKGGGGGGGVTQQSTTYTYSVSVILALCEGPIYGVPTVWKDKAVYSDGSVTALTQLGMSSAGGYIGQATWSYLTSNFPSQAIGYSGIAYVYPQDYQLGNSASVVNHSFEVRGKLYGTIAGTNDVDTASAMYDILTSTRYGASFPTSKIDISQWTPYCISANLITSILLDTQDTAGNVLAQACLITNTAPVWSGGKLKMIPYGDTASSAYGYVYTPNVTPVYDLTDDDFIEQNSGDPILVTRKAQSDCYNHIRIEFANRNNSYNVEICEAKDAASIDQYGLRSASIMQCHWICDPTVARTVAQLLLQRSVYIRTTFQFTLPWTKVMLEPMDLVTLTDAGLGFSKLPVRITEISENETGDLTVLAEDFTIGVAHSAIYGPQSGLGFQSNYNASGGSISAPLLFEAPVSLTTSGLEIYAAVYGANPLWGGCRIWISLDGTNYQQKGVVYGPSRFGALTGPISGGNAPLTINSGQLVSGSAADSAALSTLCYIGGSYPEYFAYQTATLTGSLAYTLSGLTKYAYGSNPTHNAHNAGDPFVRVDSSIAKSGPIDVGMVGKTVYLKFTSFNIYQGAEESLANVTAYSYTINGNQLLLPPSQPTGIAASLEPFGVRITINPNPEPDIKRYEYRVGASWAAGTVITGDGGANFLWAVQSVGSYTFWVAAVDIYNNYSTPVSVSATIVGGAVTTPAANLVGNALSMAWTGTAGSFAIAGYEVRYGSTWAGGTVVGFRQVTSYQEPIFWVGTRTYWVAALDVKGNYGTPVSTSVTVNAPSVVTSLYTTVVDNNALIYWTAPAIGGGQLPIDHYEVRKGSTWAGGTLIGSNGNSTFTSWFESQSGTYTYWVAAIDTAGNYGTAVSVVAVINQPPDYILRANINSTFTTGGVSTVSMTNVSYQNGANPTLLLPVNTTETWTQHFSNNGYATPQAQITAGNPIYIEPSLTSASYQEIIDYGSTLPPTNISVTLNSTPIAGTVTASCQIDYSNTSAAGPWTSGSAGATAVLASTFRWARITYTFTASGAQNLLQINGLNIKLSAKQRTDNGSATISVAASGAAVTFNYPFISADTPVVQPNGATPLIPVVVYSGGVNPTGFTVYLYTIAGALTTGSFSWSVRGY